MRSESLKQLLPDKRRMHKPHNQGEPKEFVGRSPLTWLMWIGVFWTVNAAASNPCGYYDNDMIGGFFSPPWISSCWCRTGGIGVPEHSRVNYDMHLDRLDSFYGFGSENSRYCWGPEDTSCEHDFAWLPIPQTVYIKNTLVADDHYKCWYDPFFNGFSDAQRHIPPKIRITRGSVIHDGYTDALGHVQGGAAEILTYTVQSQGTERLVISGFGSANANNVTVSAIWPPNLDMPPGGTATFSVAYSTLGSGGFSFELDISNNDNRGSKSNYDITVTGTVDTVGPATEIQNAPSVTNDTPFDVTIEFNETVSGFDAGDIVTGNGSVTDFSGSDASYSAQITPNGTGDITIDVAAGVAQDSAGNLNSAAPQVSVIYDATVLTTAIDGAPDFTNNTPFNATIQFSEDAYNFVAGDIAVGNGSVTGFGGSNAAYPIEITPDGSGDVTIDVAAAVAQDILGSDNIEAAQVSVIYDGIAPTAAISGQPAITNNSPFGAAIQFSETVADFISGDVAVVNGSVTDFSGSDADYTVQITPSGGGDIGISVASDVAHDVALNGNTAAPPVNVPYDGVAPAATIGGSPGIVNSMLPFVVTVQFSEGVSGFAVNDVAVGNGIATGISGSSASYLVQITPNGAGDIMIDVAADVAFDVALNGNTAAAQVSVTYDDIAPTATIAGAPETINSTPFDITIEFSESVSGFVAGDLTVGNGTITGFGGSDATYPVQITPDGSGDITIEVAAGVATDAALNDNTSALPVSVAYDDTSPTVQALSTPSLVNDPMAFGTTFLFSETVTGFEAEEISVGNASISNFEALAGNIYIADVTPDGLGDITIDITADVARDQAGNSNVALATTTVIYDAEPPALIIQNAPPGINTTTPFGVTFTFSEAVVGFEIGDITVENGAASNFDAVAGDIYVSDITPDGSGHVTISVASHVARDEAYNSNLAATPVVVTYFVGPPSPVPALSQWALGSLSLLITGLGYLSFRRRHRQAKA